MIETEQVHPYAVCKDCDAEFADRDEMSTHFKETYREVSNAELLAAGGSMTTSHRASVINPTDEERRAWRVRNAISDALDKACEELWDDVERGYFTTEEVRVQLRYFDFYTAWEEYIKGEDEDEEPDE